MALLVGLLGLGLAVALPLAPVVADRTEVSWPAQGEQPTSTTAFFVPYRPAEIHAEVPCSAVQAGLATGERTTVLATSLLEGAASGLVVDTEDGRLRVIVNGRLVHSAVPPASGCEVRVDSDDAATSVVVGAEEPTVLTGELVPEVFAFTTDLEPEDAAGTSVTARTRTWFESAPSPLKTAMIGGYALVVVLALVMLARWVPVLARREDARAGERGRGFRLVCDAAVVGALSLWMLIAPQTDDDGYATMTIRNGLASGDIGNYYHWFNASEAPFTLVQYIVQPFAAISAAPLWLRLPSYVVAVAAWFVISRGVLGAVLPRSSRGPLVAVLSAVCFLAWWLPFNTGVRPEPFVALGAAIVLALLVRGTAPTARRPLLFIGGAALTAGICLSVTPSSVVALAPVLVLLPRIWRTVRAAGGGAGSSWWTTVGVAALLAALAGSGLVLMFADQSLHGVTKATQLHTDIGPNLEWYEEATRYAFLLGLGPQGTATKRLAVLLTLGLLLVVALLLARRLPELRRYPQAHLLVASVALAFVLLFVTPSKWSHHFGSVAGLGAPFLVLACVLIVEVARSRSGDRVAVGTVLAGTGILALAAGLSFSGPNAWFMYSVYGLPFQDVPATPFGVPLGNPALWLLVGAATAAVVWWRYSRTGRAGSLAPLAAAPVAVTTAAVLASVALLLIGFGIAPLRQADSGGYSLALENVGTLTGTSCGIPESVDLLLDDPDGPLDPVDGADAPATSDGFVRDAGYLMASPPPDAPGTGSATYLWGSLEGGELTTGSLVSPWFELPGLSEGQEVVVSAAGRTGGTNVLELEFGRAGDGDGVTTLDRRAIGEGQPDQPTWRPLALPTGDVPATADRVRVVAVDGSTDIGGWVAVTGPRIRTAQKLHEYLAGAGPVLPDWPLAWHLPCVSDFPVVSDGLAQTPGVIIGAPKWHAGAQITYTPSEGGSFAGVSQADPREIPSRLDGAPDVEWGHVIRLDYPLARDQYDRSTDQVTLWGWEGDR